MESTNRSAIFPSGAPRAPREMRRDCHYVQYGPYTVNSTSAWYSGNSGIATVNNSGIETCISPGSTTITAQWSTIVGYSYTCGAIYANAGNGNATCNVLAPSKLVRFDYTAHSPGAPDGYGPLVLASDTNNEVRNVKNEAILTNRCGPYRNIVYELVDQNGNPITSAYAITENFSNYTSTFSGTAPASETKNISANGIINDTMFLGKTLPDCLGSNDNESFDQTFVVTINGIQYALSTVNHVSRGRFSGTYKVDVTITTP